MSNDLIPLALLAPVLIAAAYCDLRFMRIPNKLGLIALGIFIATLPLMEFQEVLLRVAAGGVLFALGFVAFAFRLFGGGDVKMLSALLLFVPSASWEIYAFVFSISMLIGIGLILAWRSMPRLQIVGWVSLTADGFFPMGISIALSGLLHLALMSTLVP